MAPYNRYMSEIDTDFFRTICLQHGEVRSYRKGEYLLHGEVFPYVGLVESGVFKYACPGTEGKTHTIGFAFEGEFVGDYPNCLYQRKPEVQIQALTPCRVILINATFQAESGKSDACPHRGRTTVHADLFPLYGPVPFYSRRALPTAPPAASGNGPADTDQGNRLVPAHHSHTHEPHPKETFAGISAKHLFRF